MNCTDTESLMAGSADGSLEPGRARTLEDHLVGCPACRSRLDEQIGVRGMLASSQAPPSPADFLSRLNARIDADREGAGWFDLADFRLWTLRLVPAAALLALVAVLWPATAVTSASSHNGLAPGQWPGSPASASIRRFSPASAADWQRDVSANALLEAALQSSSGDTHVR